MMPETALDDAITFAEKIRKLIETHPMQTQAGEIPTTVSIGVASVPHSRIASAKELIVAADKALYRAKRSGRNQVQAERRRDGLSRPTRVPAESGEERKEALG